MNQELLYKSAAYCSTAERCESDVRSKLVSWGAEDVEIDPIIDYLIAEKYVDENRYCRAFVNDKVRFAKWGKQKIAYMLEAKHVSRIAIREALETIDDEQYEQMLFDLLSSKSRTLRSVEPEQRALRLYRFAASRGFESQVISRVIKRLSE